MAVTQLITVADLEEMGDEGAYRELIEGVLQEPMSSNFEHMVISDIAGTDLSVYVRANGLGVVVSNQASFVLVETPDTMLIPDVAFVSAKRLPPRSSWKRIPRVVPDLVIEIQSPSERRRRIDTKMSIYLQAGVRLIWLIDPDARSATVYRPGQQPELISPNGTLDGEDVVPGYQLQLADLFA